MSKPTRKKVQSPFSKNLKAILEERGLSQKTAADIAGTTASTINDWLAGSQPADLLCVQKLARALKTDFEWLLTGNQSQINPKDISMTELFEGEPDPSFSGIFEISARRLKRKN
ncbi:MAG: helix-turn-helix transcriptional regulator [Bdellovibrionales bacterium]|nr:helix-turn-helix transcriptional regulator [Bdellovibrionales bacterium]